MPRGFYLFVACVLCIQELDAQYVIRAAPPPAIAHSIEPYYPYGFAWVSWGQTGWDCLDPETELLHYRQAWWGASYNFWCPYGVAFATAGIWGFPGEPGASSSATLSTWGSSSIFPNLPQAVDGFWSCDWGADDAPAMISDFDCEN